VSRTSLNLMTGCGSLIKKECLILKTAVALRNKGQLKRLWQQ
jgi:hypothetical protein